MWVNVPTFLVGNLGWDSVELSEEHLRSCEKFFTFRLKRIYSREASQMTHSKKDSHESDPNRETFPSASDVAIVESRFADGMSVQDIVETFTGWNFRLSEATFRKYVQLGLLPRSVRVRRQARQRGSVGLYPASVVSQLLEIRQLMSEGFTIDEIQRDFFFARGDIDWFEKHFEGVLVAMERAIGEHEHVDAKTVAAFDRVKQLGRELMTSIEGLESQLTLLARMKRARI